MVVCTALLKTLSKLGMLSFCVLCPPVFVGAWHDAQLFMCFVT